MPAISAIRPEQIVILIVVVVGCIIDFRTSKIPNLLTYPAAAVGIIWQSFTGYSLSGHAIDAISAALYSVAGWVTGAVIIVAVAYFPVGGTAQQKLGMGDAKLMAAVGAFLGPIGVLITFFYFCLSFGALAIFVILRAVPWDRVYGSILVSLSGAKTMPKIGTEKLRAVRKKPIPAAFGIAMGTFITILYQKETLQYFGF